MAKTFGRFSSFFIIFYGSFLWKREKHKNPYEHLTLPACHAVCYEQTSTLGKQKGFIDFTFLHFNFLIIINGVTEKKIVKEKINLMEALGYLALYCQFHV